MSGETKHSPEPWTTDDAHPGDLFDTEGWKVAECWDPENAPGNCVDVATRIRACVNACAGVPTAALEAGALAKALDAMDTRHRLDRSVVYRDGPDGIVSLVGGTLDHLRTVSATSAVEDALRALGRLP
jgi:hypothetical protein